MNWERTPTGHRCTRHNETFARGEVCRGCVAEPIKVAEIASVVPVNEHDEEIARREHDCESLAKKCHRIGDELLDGTDRDCAAAAKVIAEGTKLKRLAYEMREQRARREHIRQLRAERMKMRGMRGSN